MINDEGPGDEEVITYGVSEPEGGQLLVVGGSGATLTFPDRPGVVTKLAYRAPLPPAQMEIQKRVTAPG